MHPNIIQHYTSKIIHRDMSKLSKRLGGTANQLLHYIIGTKHFSLNGEKLTLTRKIIRRCDNGRKMGRHFQNTLTHDPYGSKTLNTATVLTLELGEEKNNNGLFYVNTSCMLGTPLRKNGNKTSDTALLYQHVKASLLRQKRTTCTRHQSLSRRTSTHTIPTNHLRSK